MADTTLSTMDAVAALMKEREKYEGWLGALDGRRATTPPRVYERVSADYRGRLDHVLAEIAGRASELETVGEELRTRVRTLEADEELRMEERAEAEVRAAVGEYSPEQWEELRSVADAEIGHVSAQLGEQRAELARVEGILAIARGPDRTAPAAPTAATAPEAKRPSTPDYGTAAVAEGNRRGAGLSIGIVPADAGSGDARRPAAESSVIIPFTVDDESGAPAREAEGAPRRPASPEAWSETGGDASFDDLAFLKSIVEPTAPSAAGQASGAPPVAGGTAGSGTSSTGGGGSTARPSPRDESRLSTPGRGLAALRSLLGTDDKSGAARSASGSTSRTDDQRAASRDESPSTAVKTLRCGECGTLNYPTEWYCERCGGELAAM